MSTMLPIIWMSPGNSFFKDKEVAYLLKQCLKRYDKAVVMVADVPATSTYLALWYHPTKAQSKARLKGNNLKNRTRRVIADLWLDAKKVIILDREHEVETSELYQQRFATIQKLYDTNESFRESVRETSASVLENAHIDYSDESVDIAVRYLLSEISFLDCASQFFGVDQIGYVYHKPRRVYEDFVGGQFDDVHRTDQQFLLMEVPYETYLTLEEQQLWRYQLMKRRNIRATFAPYLRNYFTKHDDGSVSWLMVDMINEFAQHHDCHVEYIEQSGYGVIPERLNGGYADMFCAPVWPTQYRRKKLFFTQSLFESRVYAYMRQDSQFLRDSLETLQYNQHIRIAVKEHDFHHDIVREFFPQARIVRLPQLSPVGEEIQYVIDGRADMTFWSDELTEEYCAINEYDVDLLEQRSWYGEPFKVYENCVALPRGEFALKEMLDDYVKTYRENTIT